jgi:endonuclease YncB( thermonuclease family)
MRAAALVLAVVALAPACALADFVGRVVRVTDGDTITVMMRKTKVDVRLDSIDAPEARQPFYRRSKASLAALCAGKEARVSERGKDRYGRTIGVVRCDGVDANSEQVRRGFAWVFVRYAPAGSPLYLLEAAARSTRTGLWADLHPVAPWDWRAQRRVSQ